MTGRQVEVIKAFVDGRPTQVNQKHAPRSLAAALIGRSFVHPLFDYLVVGGGLSLVLTVLVLANPGHGALVDQALFPYFALVSNSAHFAGSTVRLYTKPATSLPFLTTAFPLVALAVLTLCMWFAGTMGPHLQSLYLTWSPYHYAAQAYGLAVMYAFRSGCQLLPGDKKLLWGASLLPFFYSFVADQAAGLHWLLPTWVLANPQFHAAHLLLIRVLPYVGFAAVLLLFAKVARSASGPLPMISILMLVANAAWWYLLPQEAFVWATVFHGLQYLAIVTIFHVKDRLALPDNRRGVLYHVAWFYGTSLLLGYGLFNCLPWGFVAAGFGMVESVLLTVAAINIHHFIVDAYIWRLKKGDGNRNIVESAPVPVPLPVG